MKDAFFKLLSGKIEKATRDSAAFDLFAAISEPVEVGDKPILIPTGVSSEFSPGYVAIMKERSGLGLKGLELKAGVIDADYRGQWGVVCRFPLRFEHLIDPATNEFKVFPDPTWRPFVIEPGAKLAQFLLIETAKLEVICNGGQIVIKDEVRGERGFGSSG